MKIAFSKAEMEFIKVALEFKDELLVDRVNALKESLMTVHEKSKLEHVHFCEFDMSFRLKKRLDKKIIEWNKKNGVY